MKHICSSLFLFSILIIFVSCAQTEKKIVRDIASLQATDSVEGIWFLQGTSSVRGPYNGELELRKSFDGTYEVIRVVTYINHFYDGLKVQEVWTGKAVPNQDSIVITYELQQAGFIAQMGSAKRKQSDFNNPMTVNVLFKESSRGLEAQFDDGNLSKYSEWLTTQRKLDATPLWVDKRKYLDARGGLIPASIKKNIEKYKQAVGFAKSDFWKAHKKCNLESSSGLNIIFDPTDFDFYRRNNEVIRVVNKITDTISISEAAAKRNAYAPLLRQKAFGFDRSIHQQNLNEFGRIQVGEGSLEANESAFLTGIYSSSQAMRYLATNEVEALKNATTSLSGLFYSIDNAKKNSSASYLDAKALVAVLHGMAWAALVLPKTDVNLRSSLFNYSLDILKITEKLDDKGLNTTASAVVALFAEDDKFQILYRSYYDKILENKKQNLADISFYWQGSADWSAAQARMFNTVTEIMVTDVLGMTQIRDHLRKQLMEQWNTYAPAQRGLMTMLANEFSYKKSVMSEADSGTISSSEHFSSALAQAVWALREIPFPRPQQVVRIDHSLDKRWCVSPIPRDFWNNQRSKDVSPKDIYQGGVGFPAFELSAFSSNFIWEESPFQYSLENNKGIEGLGVDYLYAYWLGRYSGVNYDE